ncbi:MAG: putative redox protein [Dasania sp.]|jgi:putative redox protein
MTDTSKTISHIIETGESPYTVNIKVNGFTFKGDEPESFGGGNTGPSPYDLLLAALGECTAMTVRWYALHKQWPLDKVEVTATHQKIDKQDTFEKKITLHGDSLSAEQRQKLIEISSNCPIQKTLEGNVEISVI